MRYSLLASALLCAGLAAAVPAQAQQKGPPSYGPTITFAQAQKVAAAAFAESAKQGWREAVAIVEPNGQLLYFGKMDDTQYGSIKVALNKATSAALFRRPTKAFQQGLEKGATKTIYLLQLEGANAVPGGIPIMTGGHVIGGIGCSGGTGDQDIQVCEAGLKALQ